MKQNVWLYNIKLFLVLSALLTLNSCKRIKEVEVFVYDVETMEGIPNIIVSYGDEQSEVTDNSGKVILSDKKNMKGNFIVIPTWIKGYVTPNFYENCISKTSFEIESDEVKIPLDKLKPLKLIFRFDSTIATTNRQGCMLIEESLACEAKLSVEFIKKESTLEIPGIVGHNQFSNAITFSITKSPNPVKLSLFYETDENCRNTNEIADKTYTIQMNPTQDTTYHTVYLD